MASLVIVRSTPTRFRVAVALAVTSAVLVGACGGDDGGDDAEAPQPKTTEPEKLEVAIDLEAGPTAVTSAGPDVALAPEIIEAVMGVVDGYVDEAVAGPLATGKPAKDLERFFGLRVITNVGPDGANRAALTEEGVPRATDDVTITAEPVALTALADPAGNVLMVNAALDLRLKTKVEGGPIEIVRTGELLLEPFEGKWQITGYDLEVRRTTASGTTTTTAKTGDS